MESDTRFDLKPALVRWTSDFATRDNLEPGKIAELESHLRDSIADLRQRGLDDAESFLIATRRLGSPAEIEAEFEKTESALLPRRALWWFILGVAGSTTLGGALGTLKWVLALVSSSFAANPTTFAAFVVGANLLSLGLFAWALLAVVNQRARIQWLVNFSTRHPWRLALSLLLANGLFWVANVLSSAFLFRGVSASLAGEFARILNISSIISPMVSLGIIALILAKVRPADIAI